MANQSEMLARLRALYMPRAINIADMAARVEACAAYWQLLSPAQRNAIAMLNKDAAIWKAGWDAQQARLQAPPQWTKVTNDPSTWPPADTDALYAWEEDAGEFKYVVDHSECLPYYGEGVCWMPLPPEPAL